MAKLSLFLLGPPRVELVEGIPVEIKRRKALALLIYLAVSDDRQLRDSLATLLWPQSSQQSARKELRRNLSVLNQALGGNWLDIDRESVGLRAGFWLDVVQFQQHLADETIDPPTLIAAVDLYRGDFLTGFTLPDCPEFDEWQFFQSESLRQTLASALERLVGILSDQTDHEAAISYARRWLALDPLHEPVHRQLMLLYAQAAQQAAALRQYDLCRQTLEDELGISPTPETTALYERIRARKVGPAELATTSGPEKETPLQAMAGELRQAAELSQALESVERGGRARQTEPAFSPVQPPAFLNAEAELTEFDWPVLVDREGELAQLDSFLKNALAGRGQLVFVTGEAGQGKTSLVNEFVRQAQATHADLIVANGYCNAYAGLGAPYLPFRDVMEMLTGAVEAKWAAGAITREHAVRLWHLLPITVQDLLDVGPDLIDIFVPGTALVGRATTAVSSGATWLAQLKELTASKPTGSTNLEQSYLFEQYARVLQSLAAQRPLLITLDDLQWADTASISLLFHLGRRIGDSQILIVGAYRPEEELADSYVRLEQHTQAIFLYQTALDRWASLSDADGMIAVRLHRKILQRVFHMRWIVDHEQFEAMSGTAAASQDYLEANLTLTEAEPPQLERVRVLTTLAHIDHGTRLPSALDTAERYAQAAVELAEQLDAPEELADALNALADVYFERGQSSAHLTVSRRLLDIFRDPRYGNVNLRKRIFTLHTLGNAMIPAGEYARAVDYFVEAEHLLTQYPALGQPLFALSGQALCWLRLDRWDELLQVDKRRRDFEERYSYGRFDGSYCMEVAVVAAGLALQGDFDQVRVLREQAYEFMVRDIGQDPSNWGRTAYY